MSIPEKFKFLREEKGYSKKNLVEKLGIKYSTYAGYEAGTREPNSDVLKLISNFYNVSIDYILDLTDNPIKSSFKKINTNEVLKLSTDEEIHIKKYRTIDERGRKNVDTILEVEYVNAIKKDDEQEYMFIASRNGFTGHVPISKEEKVDALEILKNIKLTDNDPDL